MSLLNSRNKTSNLLSKMSKTWANEWGSTNSGGNRSYFPTTTSSKSCSSKYSPLLEQTIKKAIKSGKQQLSQKVKKPTFSQNTQLEELIENSIVELDNKRFCKFPTVTAIPHNDIKSAIKSCVDTVANQKI